MIKSMKKFVPAGLALLTIVLLLPLAGCETEVNPSTPQQEQTGGENPGSSGKPQVATYTVTFNANGGEGTMESQTFTAGTTQPLSANEFQRSGWAFNGWNTMTDGSGASYDDKASFTATEDTTLYAKWRREIIIGDIGDIFYSDYTISSEYQTGKIAVGVVIESEDGVAKKVLSLVDGGYMLWAKEGTLGETTKFNTSTDGSDNWAVIQAEDPDGSSDAATNYPAFHWCNTLDTGGITGWYLPAHTEWESITPYLNKVQSAITKVNIDVSKSYRDLFIDTPEADQEYRYWTSTNSPTLEAFYASTAVIRYDSSLEDSSPKAVTGNIRKANNDTWKVSEQQLSVRAMLKL